MTKQNILNLKLEEVGTVELPKDVFGIDPKEIEAKKPLLFEVVTALRAGQRQGTHATKTRGEVSGGGRKPFKQKGTGRARQGSSREPQHRHGGIAHGPQPKSYWQKINSKKYQQAIKLSFSDRNNNSNIYIFDNLTPEDKVSTKSVANALHKLEINQDRKNLFIINSKNTQSLKSIRNIKNLVIANGKNVNPYDVLVSDKVFFDVEGLVEFTKDDKLVKLNK